ncbi:MAG: hypothetical protein NUV65_00205 [Candidatus Roizmanbacteria bacterium]|nr:hypothetical protein [Candidatus Roizmanbacteria bacterium]
MSLLERVAEKLTGNSFPTFGTLADVDYSDPSQFIPKTKSEDHALPQYVGAPAHPETDTQPSIYGKLQAIRMQLDTLNLGELPVTLQNQKGENVELICAHETYGEGQIHTLAFHSQGVPITTFVCSQSLDGRCKVTVRYDHNTTGIFEPMEIHSGAFARLSLPSDKEQRFMTYAFSTDQRGIIIHTPQALSYTVFTPEWGKVTNTCLLSISSNGNAGQLPFARFVTNQLQSAVAAMPTSV